jgi:hypothetical protein
MMVDSPSTILVQYGEGNYNTLSAAQVAPIASPPPIVSGVGVLLGRIIVLKNAAVFADISSAFGTQFTPTTANDHELLAGLLGGAANDHYHITSVQATVVANTSGTNTGDQDLSGLVPNTRTVNGHALSSNVTITTTDIGLGNVDNTSDVNKPVSTAQQTALNLKEDVVNKATNFAVIDDTKYPTTKAANKRSIINALIFG